MTRNDSTERTLFDVADDEPTPELVPVSHATALATTRPTVTESPLAVLAGMEHGLAIMERRAQILAQIRKAALKITDPRDWVQGKGRNDEDSDAVCIMTNSGARKIAPYYEISVHNVRPQDAQGIPAPIQEQGEEGEILLTLYADVFVGLTREAACGIRASRSTKEQFIGRGGLETTSPLVAKSDITSAVYTLLFTKAVRLGAGMKNVPVRELADAWKGTDKKVESIPRGSGFGSSTERGASSVASDDVKVERKKLGDEILSRVGGDKDAARSLLKEVTANPPKFPGFDSVERLTKGWQVEAAWKNLRAHATYGDDSAKGGTE